MIHLGSGKTSKQFAALSSSAAANFGSRRRCCFLHPPQQADRGAGIPPLFQHQAVGPLEQGVLGWFWQHHPPALMAPFVPAQILHYSCQGRLEVCSTALYLFTSLSPGPALVLTLTLLEFPLEFPKGISIGRGNNTSWNTCCCLAPLKFRRGFPSSPLQELQLLSSS